MRLLPSIRWACPSKNFDAWRLHHSASLHEYRRGVQDGTITSSHAGPVSGRRGPTCETGWTAWIQDKSVRWTAFAVLAVLAISVILVSVCFISSHRENRLVSHFELILSWDCWILVNFVHLPFWYYILIYFAEDSLRGSLWMPCSPVWRALLAHLKMSTCPRQTAVNQRHGDKLFRKCRSIAALIFFDTCDHFCTFVSCHLQRTMHDTWHCRTQALHQMQTRHHWTNSYHQWAIERQEAKSSELPNLTHRRNVLSFYIWHALTSLTINTLNAQKDVWTYTVHVYVRW